MKNKYFLILLNVLITLVSLYFSYSLFENYKKEQNVKVNKYLENRIKINKSFIKNAFLNIHKEIVENKKIFLQIHQEALQILQKNNKITIEELKEKLESKYKLNDVDFHLFYINKDYVITESTYTPDIGFDLSLVTDAQLELNRSNFDNLVHQSSSISVDIINSDIKSYSYSKVNDLMYLEIGFLNHNIKSILKETMKHIVVMSDSQSQLYRIEQKLDNTEYYDNILKKNTDLTKEEYLQSKEKFPKDMEAENPVIKSNREGKIIKKYVDNAIVFYIPLIKKNNKYLEVMSDFVLELYIDVKYENELNDRIVFYFYIFIFIHLFLLIIISFFTKKYHDSTLAMQKEKELKFLALEENKELMNLMAVQMNTPLSIITDNFILLQEELPLKFKKYLTQVDSGIHMVKKSYNDLKYLSLNKSVIYKDTCINIINFIKNRIDFFSSIFEVENRKINYIYDENIYININAIELERLIDNNLSNAIKYSKKHSTVYIKCFARNNLYCLSFSSNGEIIKDSDKIFIKNYQENNDAKRSLGLGLNMVKSICKKYDIFYEVRYENEMNVFKYYFKATSKKD